MKAKVLLSIATLMFVCALAAGVAMSSAAGPTVSHLQAHGWTCTTPHLLFHCRPPGSNPLPAGPASLHLLVFDTSGTNKLGTETLIRSDLYAGQPCHGTPVGQYELISVGRGYYGCHHFALPS